MGFLAGGFMYLMHPRLHSGEEGMNNGHWGGALQLMDMYIPPDEVWTCWEE